MCPARPGGRSGYGRGYQTALREWVLASVGMRRTTLVTEPSVLPDDRADGVTATGVQRDPWIGAGYLPAGVGVWSTAADVGRFVQQTMTGAAPGASAARPRSRVTDDQRIGLGWFTDRMHHRTITWHNGHRGVSSWVGFDRDARRAVLP